MRIGIGADHAGFPLKQTLVAYLNARGDEVEDFGTHDTASCDYPDFAQAVAEATAAGRVDVGILICGSGIGMAIAANKVPGVRAACCSEPVSARLTRADNNANVLTMGARLIGPAMAEAIVEAFLTTPFAGGRHQRRLDKIRALERGAGASPQA